MRFKNKIIIVTGAAGEIAQEMIKIFLKEGGFVIAIALRKNTLKPFKKHLDKKGLTQYEQVIADISDLKNINNIVNKVIKKYKKIDILVNHVGVTQCESLQSTTTNLWLKDININLNGTYFITNACLKYMKNNNYGNIVTIGSVNSDRAIGNPAYSSAKAALVSYMKAVATEYGQYNIRANTVSPGSVHTKAWNFRIKKNPKIFNNLLKWYPLKCIATPLCVAKAVLFLASDDASCISGINLRVDAGLSAGVALFAKDITSENFGV